MSTKYTPLGSTDDQRTEVSEIPPSYELGDVETGSSREAANFSPAQPLTVKFYQDIRKTIDLELNYYSHQGVKGIHDMVKRKLDTLGIELNDENYLIGVFQDNYKFRLITIDDDSTGNKIHYFKCLQKDRIQKDRKYSDYKIGAMFIGVCLLIILLLILIMLHLINSHEASH